MTSPSLADLRRAYYGGNSANEYATLLALQNAGITGAHVLNSVGSGPQAGAGYVFFGDSYAANSFAPGYRANQVTFWIEALTNGKLRLLNNSGVSGNTTAQMLARFTPDVLAYNPQLCIMMTSGVNDINTDVALATTKANLTAMFNLAKAAGITLITVTVPPSSGISTLARRQNVFALNRWLMNQAATRKGLIVVDIWSLLQDPASTSVQFVSTLTSDGTHCSVNGAFIAGQAIANVVNAIIKGSGPQLASSLADPYELLPNPTMRGNTAGVATNMTSSGGVGTATKVTRTDGVQGEWQQWAHTSGTELLYQSSAAASLVAGDIITGWIEVKVDPTGFTPSGSGVYVYLQTRTAGGAAVDTVQCFLSDATQTPASGITVVPFGLITSGASTDFVRAAMSITGTGGTFSLGRMSVRKVSSP